MQSLSVVIVCKNEADIITSTLQSLQGITDDIIVYDNGSTDGTPDLVKQYPVKLYQGSWEGFGKTKGKANALAKYDWILSLDADEAADEELKQSLINFNPTAETIVYKIAYKNFLGNKYLRFGEWGWDYHTRLFNRKKVHWDEAPVHEKLILPAETVIKTLRGHILHRTMKDVDDYKRKMTDYAELGARKYFEKGKKSGWIKRTVSPAFTFFHYYILKLGFLDGREGFICARMTAWYTAMKYKRLKEMQQKKT